MAGLGCCGHQARRELQAAFTTLSQRISAAMAAAASGLKQGEAEYASVLSNDGWYKGAAPLSAFDTSSTVESTKIELCNVSEGGWAAHWLGELAWPAPHVF
jgi:hypothetical protein